MRFIQRVVVVTGAASGIGAATARAFAAEGAQVVATDIITVGLQQWRSNGLRMAHDVGCERGWQGVVQEAVERFGGIDVLVNNAGIGWEGPLTDTPPARWQEIMRTNVEGPYLGMKHVVPIMRRKGEGAIVNVASVSALVGSANSSLYAASSGAVVSMSRAAAVELAGQGIRINSLSPGGGAHPDVGAPGLVGGLCRATRQRRARLGGAGGAHPLWPAGRARGGGPGRALPRLCGGRLDHRHQLGDRRRLRGDLRMGGRGRPQSALSHRHMLPASTGRATCSMRVRSATSEVGRRDSRWGARWCSTK